MRGVPLPPTFLIRRFSSYVVVKSVAYSYAWRDRCMRVNDADPLDFFSSVSCKEALALAEKILSIQDRVVDRPDFS